MYSQLFGLKQLLVWAGNKTDKSEPKYKVAIKPKQAERWQKKFFRAKLQSQIVFYYELLLSHYTHF